MSLEPGADVARYIGVTNSSVTRFIVSGKRPDVDDFFGELEMPCTMPHSYHSLNTSVNIRKFYFVLNLHGPITAMMHEKSIFVLNTVKQNYTLAAKLSTTCTIFSPCLF